MSQFKALLVALVCTVQATQYGDNHVPVWKDPPQVAANFPQPNITLYSPAFADRGSVPTAFQNGTEGPTSNALVDYFLQSIAERNWWCTYAPASYLSEEGRTFPSVYLSKSSQPWTSSQPWASFQPWNITNTETKPKARVWIQGGVHGSEPGGDQAVLALLGKMNANQTWTESILENADIMLLPRYNPDGVSYFQRTLASNFDPNRDHIKLARQQTRDIKRTFSQFAPHVAVDMHEFTAGSIYGGKYVPGADALFSAAKNLNINSGIREMSEQLFAPAIASGLEGSGFRWEPYVTGKSSRVPNSTITYVEADSDARIGRNAMGMSQSIAFLCEIRGIGIADQHFYRRVAVGLNMLESIVQTAADNAEDVVRVVEGGISDFIHSQDPVVITDSLQGYRRNWTFIDYASGNLVQVPVNFYTTTPTIANLTRPRPEAYLIPRAWSDLATRLEASGVVVDKLPYKYRDLVEALTVTSSTLADSYYEGAVLNSVTTNSTSQYVEVPVGSYWINMRQKNAALAVVALEPENSDSYVSFGIVPMGVGDEYPIYRIVSDSAAQ